MNTKNAKAGVLAPLVVIGSFAAVLAEPRVILSIVGLAALTGCLLALLALVRGKAAVEACFRLTRVQTGVVVVTCALLVGALTWTIVRWDESASERRRMERHARATMGFVDRAIRQFFLQRGQLPTDLDTLVESEPQFLDRIGLDPWGMHFRYDVVLTAYRLGSLGPDRLPDTADDIWYGRKNGPWQRP